MGKSRESVEQIIPISLWRFSISHFGSVRKVSNFDWTLIVGVVEASFPPNRRSGIFLYRSAKKF